jgi:hypothetical protein
MRRHQPLVMRLFWQKNGLFGQKLPFSGQFGGRRTKSLGFLPKVVAAVTLVATA